MRLSLLPTAAVAAIATVPAAPATAQAEAPVEQVAGVPDILVTGERQTRSLLDTAASVGVVTAADIQRTDVTSFREAFRLLGNVLDSDWVDGGFIIRGINSEGLTPGGNPLASVYIDGAQQTIQGARRGARGLWDVEQVEVYRGPQSTLSGRASLAGAIYIRTVDPGFEWSGAARVSAGELGTLDGAVAVGGPLSDKIAFRIVAEYQHRDSEISYPAFENFARYDQIRRDEYWQLRGKLLAKTSDNVKLIISYSYADDSPAYDDVAGPGFGFDYFDRRGDFNLPFFQEVRSATNHSASAELVVGLSDRLDFTSLTTYGSTNVRIPSINQGTPGERFVTDGVQTQRLFTQELRLNLSRDKLSGVVGLYLSTERNRRDTDRSTFFGGGRLDNFRDNFEIDSYALFGEGTLRVSPAIRLVAGGRLNHERQRNETSFSRDNFNPALPDISTTGSSRVSQTVFLPKAAVLFDLATDTTLGFTVQRGFRSGGSGVNGVTGQPFSFAPEYTWNYEGSLKSKLMDGKLFLTANLFYTDWRDQQVELLLDPLDFTTGVTLNAASSRVFGGELEARAVPHPNLQAFVSLGITDAKFKEFVDLKLGDFSGLSFPEAPRYTISAGLDWRPKTGFFIGGDVRHVSSYFARDLQNAPIDRVGNYVLVNARAGWQADRWSLMVFADNLLNEQYFVYRDVIGDFECCATLGRSRIVGVTGRVSF
jgi:outer membrane receptor protein involved in Fe transport